jgi:serine/threonine protein phosphatase 1
MNKIYAFSDVHGIYDLWAQIRDYCDETDTIYFLGDACDRGEDGLKIINELLNDKRVRYLKGNHEDILTICVPEFIEGHFENMSWWVSNGGRVTWDAIQKLTDEEKMALVYKLEKLPKYVWYQNKQKQKIFLSHAGTDLNYTEKELITMGRKDPYLWDRKHFFAKCPIDKQNVFQIHGHTPVQNLRHTFHFFYPEVEEITEVFYYMEHKFDIDMCSFASGRTALIDLDTFEVIYFNTTKGIEVL